MQFLYYPLAALVAALAFIGGFYLNRRLARNRVRSAESLAGQILTEARREAENLKKAAELEVKEQYYQEKLKFETETANRRKELDRTERRLVERAQALDKKDRLFSERESDYIHRTKNLQMRERVLNTKTERLDQLIDEQNARLERIASMSAEEAKRELFKNLENQARLEAAQMIKEIKDRARQEADREAKEIVVQAIQRCAISHWSETTVSVVPLPSDEMKGRIIGREGRNIRAFETLTGVEVVIDDTPGAVIISAFEPIRREVAKLAMEKLVSDGRIHPARIEEVVAKVRADMDTLIRESGEEVVLELGVSGLHSELVKLLGRLRYRTSFGQNVLQHSREVAHLAGLLASQLDLDPVLARRAGLLHDVGKAADQTFEGPHAKIGAELAATYGETEPVLNAIAAHHEEVPLTTPYAFLVLSADSISGARPGARRETFEAYIKRLENLEAIAQGMNGIEKAYAIQAGREIRVLVQPERVTDAEAQQMAGKIAEQIQNELKYPGQIKVVVIRETRAIDYAK